MRLAALLLTAAPLLAGPKAPVPLRDLKPRFVNGRERLLRNRLPRSPGLPVAKKTRRGLSSLVPFRAGFEIDAAFERFVVSVGVIDGGREPVVFRILGDGRPLASTPPLFAGAKPVTLDVRLEGVILLELAAEGAGKARGVFMEGKLWGAEGRDLERFRPTSAPFSPTAYLTSFRRSVNETIDRAVRHLLSTRQANGSWKSSYHTAGTTALVALALLKAGVKNTDPAIVEAFQYLRQYEYDHVYSVSTLLMALEARYFPKGAVPREAVKVIPADDQVWIRQAAKWLQDQQGAGFPKNQRGFHPVWRYPRGGYDLSNTQYALFGLTAARRCGVPSSHVFLPALRYLLGGQDKDGPVVTVSRYFRAGKFMRRRTERAKARGFGYQIEGPRTGSMTSAGLCALILCQAAGRGKAVFERNWRNKTRVAIRDALAWLEEYYEIEENPFRGKTWWVYYLFNIERVGVLLDQRYLGTRDWYEEGAIALMKEQEEDGRIAGGPINTAFALLFLKRATVSPLTQGR